MCHGKPLTFATSSLLFLRYICPAFCKQNVHFSEHAFTCGLIPVPSALKCHAVDMGVVFVSCSPVQFAAHSLRNIGVSHTNDKALGRARPGATGKTTAACLQIAGP